MKRILRRLFAGAILSAIVPLVTPDVASAGNIQRACQQTERRAASPRLCACIDRVARVSLTARDRRLAVRIFRDPHLAQEIRQSDRRSHEAFWKRYKTFGSRASATCAS